MIDVLGSTSEFDASYKAHSPIVVQSLTKRFCHENEEIGGERAALSEAPGGLERFTRSTVDQGGDPWSRNTGSDNINEGRFKAHFF